MYPKKGFINVINPSSNSHKPFLGISQFLKPLHFCNDNTPFEGLLFVSINPRQIYHYYKSLRVYQNATYNKLLKGLSYWDKP